MVTSAATVAGLSGSKPSPVVRGNSSRWRPKPGGRGGMASSTCLGTVNSEGFRVAASASSALR